MAQRFVPAFLILLLLVLHGQLWFGRGSIAQVNELRTKLDAQRAANARAVQTNQRLASDLADLREGMEMVEEKARSELGMVKPNEIYVHTGKR